MYVVELSLTLTKKVPYLLNVYFKDICLTEFELVEIQLIYNQNKTKDSKNSKYLTK